MSSEKRVLWFNPATSIRFSVPEAGLVQLRIYDVAGRVVRMLMAGAQGAGRFQVAWDGTDEAGRRVASGVYFYRLEASGATLTRKMLLLK
ncbi:MAG: T9SS type A sorting domain-containing protein [Candidatus Latescibacteria bacterium]|nr:T9SS type A sorting domain-containing protein [Candidatus Latescibacterota bacterium]